MRSTFEERVFNNKKWLSENLAFVDGDFRRFQRDFCKFVIILAWNRDGK